MKVYILWDASERNEPRAFIDGDVAKAVEFRMSTDPKARPRLREVRLEGALDRMLGDFRDDYWELMGIAERMGRLLAELDDDQEGGG